MLRIVFSVFATCAFLALARAGDAAGAPRMVADVSYLAPDRAEKLDLYLPAAPTKGTLSRAVVWIHGGGWTGGVKTENRAKEICATLAAAGYVAVSVDYRLGAGAWPHNLHDCKNAVRFLRAHAAKYQLDPERIAVAGGSAGGHLALMVGFTGDQPEFEPTGVATPYPGVSSKVRAVIDLYGPANLLTRQEVDAAGAPTGKFRAVGPAAVYGTDNPAAPVYVRASPVTHVTKNSPPVLILHGQIDLTVDRAQSEELAGVLAKHGVPHELVRVAGAGHTFDFETWNKQPLSRDLRPVALAFLEKHLSLKQLPSSRRRILRLCTMTLPSIPSPAPRRPDAKIFALVLLAAVSSASAQTAAAAAEKTTTPPDSAVTLTPFEVNSDRDTGFAAASSLAGGRLASDLRDTPAAFSVITREFIDALNLTDLMQAQDWATGSTFQSDIGTNNFTTFTVRYNSRGVSAGQQLRNFFPVNSDNDSYALERYDFGRGANSIVFGNGSLGGVSSSTTKRARTDRAFQDVKLTAGSYSMMRATIDVNQPINNKIALRVAGVAQHGLGWRQKQFEKRKGVFATATLRPFLNTVVRLEAEAINREINQPINNLQDQLSGWNGSTTFATPAALNGASAAQITALQAQGVARRGANYNVYDPYNGFNAISSYTNEAISLGGGTTATTPIAGFVSGSNAAFGLTNTNLVNAMNVPTNRFDLVESRSGFIRPSERFSINQDGPLLESSFRDLQLTVEQKLGDFYVELAGDVNKNSNYTNGEQNRGASATYLDLNRVLPNGAPNAHYLQAYGDGNFFRGFRHYDYHNVRAAVAWKQNTRFGNFAINTMVGENKNHYTLSYQWLSLAQGTDTLAWINGTAATVKIRRYWNEPSRPFVDLAGKPIPYYDPNTRTTTTVTPRWVIDHTRFDAESVNDTSYRYGLAALNAKFWKDRLIFLGAVRRDRYQSGSQQMAVSGDYPTDRDPLKPLFKPQAPADWSALSYVPVDAAGRALPAAPAITRPRLTGGVRDPRYTQYRFRDDFNAPVLSGYVNTKSVGTVMHLLSWVSPSVNYAESFNPQKAYALLQGGGIIQPTISTGWNYSTRFEFFQRKLDVNLTYYTSEEINNPSGVSGFPFNALLEATPMGSTADLNKRGLPRFIGGSDLQDRVASGYEAEVTVNVIKGLRVTGSVSLPKVYGANAYQLTRAYVEKNREAFKLIVQDTGARVDANNVATVDPAIPADQLSPEVNAAADAYNTIFTAYNNLNIARTTGNNQPLYKFFGDYTIQEGKTKGLRFGVGVQYRGREILGNRGADTIVDPANPTRAIDDPTRSILTPLMSPKGDTTVTSTFGYLWRFDKRAIQLNLVINNLLNDRAIYWTTSTNGTATSALRPRDGNYNSPARETVPVGFGLKQPINFNVSASWRM